MSVPNDDKRARIHLRSAGGSAPAPGRGLFALRRNAPAPVRALFFGPGTTAKECVSTFELSASGRESASGRVSLWGCPPSGVSPSGEFGLRARLPSGMSAPGRVSLRGLPPLGEMPSGEPPEASGVKQGPRPPETQKTQKTTGASGVKQGPRPPDNQTTQKTQNSERLKTQTPRARQKHRRL